MLAVVANAPSCPLVRVTSWDCSVLLGQGWLPAVPGDRQRTSLTCPSAGGRPVWGVGRVAGKGCPVSLAFCCRSPPPGPTSSPGPRGRSPVSIPNPFANVAETWPGWGSRRERRGSRRVRVGAAAGLAGINLIIQLIKLIPGGPAPCRLSGHRARIQAGAQPAKSPPRHNPPGCWHPVLYSCHDDLWT